MNLSNKKKDKMFRNSGLNHFFAHLKYSCDVADMSEIQVLHLSSMYKSFYSCRKK